jgi:uncharacterized protein (TIGR00255 family)
MIVSMTGYASKMVLIGDESFKIELKSLNHRFLDVKLRMPRDLGFLESGIKGLFESRIKRGSLDAWIERIGTPRVESTVKVNEGQLAYAHEVLSGIRSQYGLKEEIQLKDLISFPDVLIKKNGDERSEEAAAALKGAVHEAVSEAIDDLIRMRISEGERLKNALLSILMNLRISHEKLKLQRTAIQNRAKDKVRKKIDQCFQAYSSPDEAMRALMETRIAQEISYSLEKLDIEEELTRFLGHLDAIESQLEKGGQVGKRLDFLFQELNREINTLGNKSQDLEISKEVIELKMWVEQMREQSLNLE